MIRSIARALLILVVAAPAQAQLQVTTFVDALSSPLAFIQDPSNANVHYVVEQDGRIRLVVNGTLRPTPFLDIDSLVQSGGERGLLGLAFPPDYAASGRFYVNYTREPDGHTVIARYTRSSGDPFVADPGSRFDLVWPNVVNGQVQLLPYIMQPASNHNGGNMRFGPDGYLYIGMGDGGGSGDAYHTAQNPNTLLGKILRVDVNVPDGDTRGFASPADNPFRDGSPIGALDEIWAFGVRNPWRFSFDAPTLGTGGMWMGDVGQGAREEIDYAPPGAGGRNYGWPLREGSQAYPTSDSAAYTPLLEPVFDYPRSSGQSVTGGYVYRGTALAAALRGRFFFADFVLGRVWSLAFTTDPSTGEVSYVSGSLTEHTAELGGSGTLGNIASLDVDAAGEMYLVSHSEGKVLKITAPDTDGDGLPTGWETFFGLDPGAGGGADGATGDPDGDGRTNLEEFNGGTHPRGVAANTRYFAEGATSTFFDTTFAVLNTSTSPAAVLFRFLQASGTVVTHQLAVPAGRRATLDAKSIAGLGAAEFATTVETDTAVVVDRSMVWGTGGYGSHGETAQVSPAARWYFAEGATHSGFDLFYLLQNSSLTATSDGFVRFLLPSGQQVVVPFTLQPSARQTIWVDTIPGLENTDVAAVVEVQSGAPIIAERAMYLSGGGETYRAGHESAGATAPATDWFLAEGSTGPYFDEFILLANPGASPATATITYLRQNGPPVSKAYGIGPNSRVNVWVDLETVSGVSLADEALSARISSDQPIIVERSMWWPLGPGSWVEAHNSFAATATGTRWGIADGEVGGAASQETYVLVANTSAGEATVAVTLYFEDGPTATKTFTVPATSRFNVPIAQEFPAASGKRFGTIVESQGGAPAALVVERAIYRNAGGMFWAAGASALAARLP